MESSTTGPENFMELRNRDVLRQDPLKSQISGEWESAVRSTEGNNIPIPMATLDEINGNKMDQPAGTSLYTTRSKNPGSHTSTHTSKSRRSHIDLKLREEEELAAVEMEAMRREQEIKRRLIRRKFELEQAELNDDDNNSDITVDSLTPTSEPCGQNYVRDIQLSRGNENVQNWLQNSDPISQMAQAFKMALDMGTQHENSDMRKFVARQASQRDLPSFSGKPEEWPRVVRVAVREYYFFLWLLPRRESHSAAKGTYRQGSRKRGCTPYSSVQCRKSDEDSTNALRTTGPSHH